MGRLILFLFILPAIAQAAGAERTQARLFAGRLFSQPTDFNAQMSNQSLSDFGTIDKVGVEVGYNLFDLSDVGLRFMRNSANDVYKPNQSLVSRYAVVSQDTVQFVARIPVFKRPFFKADVFGAYGGSNTTITVNNQIQMGHGTHSFTHDGFNEATVISYGASAGIGWKGTYLFVEVGNEINKVSSFTRDGSVSTSIDSIDLSGPYWIVGLHFDGTMGATNVASKVATR